MHDLGTTIALIFVAHLVGDYVLQTDWMAGEKTKRWLPAFVHGFVYMLPFLVVTQSPLALLTIALTHVVIDRFRLARYVIWFSNQLGPKAYRYSLAEAKTHFGYSKNKPPFIAVWLLFIVDNTLHLIINILSAVYL